MIIDDLLIERNMTKHYLAKRAGIAYNVLDDICSGKTKIQKCSIDTLGKIAKILQVPVETLIESDTCVEGNDMTAERTDSYEYGLPGYLQYDLDAYKDGLQNGTTLMDCLWGELYGSINAAEITDGAITSEHADYLRRKYLWGQEDE